MNRILQIQDAILSEAFKENQNLQFVFQKKRNKRSLKTNLFKILNAVLRLNVEHP